MYTKSYEKKLIQLVNLMKSIRYNKMKKEMTFSPIFITMNQSIRKPNREELSFFYPILQMSTLDLLLVKHDETSWIPNTIF